MKKLLLFLLTSCSAFSQSIPLDESFNPGTGANHPVAVVKQLSTGKVLVGGQFTSFNGVDVPPLVRLNPDGSIDNSFSANITGFVDSVVAEEDGKVVVAGYMSPLVRLNIDGSIDSGFNPPAFGGGSGVYNVVKQGTKYIVAGDFITLAGENFYKDLARLNSDGSLDTTFQPTDFGGTLDYGEVYVQQDGSLIVYGGFEYYNGVVVNNIIRLHENGTLDTDFNAGSAGNGVIREVEAQADGKYIVSGYFTTWNGDARKFFVRLNTDGNIDNSFNYVSGPGLPEDGFVAEEIFIRPDNKVIAAGWFRDAFIDIEGTADGSIPVFMVRLNSDGSTDPEFNPGFNNGVYAMDVQEDGKILAGGWFTMYNDEEVNFVTRLDVDALDVDNYQAENLMVYPNPVADVLNINTWGGAEVALYDISGKLLCKTRGTADTIQLDMSGYSQGFYVLHISKGGSTQSHKIFRS